MKDKLPENPKEKQKLFSRIKRLSGQVAAVERAVTEGDECADILKDHVRLHIAHPNRGPGTREELTEDLISLVRAYLK
jgi:DNA-binding FrmR family transcriptional regulator